ncbi:Regulator of chromosome condensation (RCC1) repeat [Carpediemonas membranifera]|uniref:Regulator of chromosome condensation (RCC1) repeat n=1 Tax=Carpediemonas membranifera TaxID=201153 RepID=A0A8J6DY24_9EUKA|nr:Regulator of chromosome condensation (RCC1) repeat [Carpediemonas membranifera]|eukprot:KAG9391404.1 Regulator of chromosome condensation (RCC1) repeat [Carpediemonas membranifera]
MHGMMLQDEAIDARIAKMDASHARLAAMRSSMPQSNRNIHRAAFIAINARIPFICANIRGDIPALMRMAFTHEFGEEFPDNDSEADPTTTEETVRALMALDLHNRRATSVVRRITAVLTRRPELSMNIPLAPGEELPVAMYTLNQGAVWACLMGDGANPDLEDRVLKEAREKQPDYIEMHDKIRNALTPEAKCLWFLCRKFFFSLNVAEKDGESYLLTELSCYHHRMYMGRLFMLDTDKHTALTRARMPRALEVYSDRFTHIARTPKSLWGWGDNRSNQLGFESAAGGVVDPTRLTFAACPKVAELEASLPPWEKHRMVSDVSMSASHTFILTPVGTVVAGVVLSMYVGPVEEDNKHLFHPVAVPDSFVPDHIMNSLHTVILSMGDRQVMSGENKYSQLGLGHDDAMSGFVDLPFRVDRVVSSINRCFNVFLSGRQLLFAGLVRRHIAQSGLPGFDLGDLCDTPTPLRFPERVKEFYCDEMNSSGSLRARPATFSGVR